MGCPRITYSLSSRPRLRCVYNAGGEGDCIFPFAHNEQPSLFLNRGYTTGHEHLPEFGLINMNARLYDPLIGRMLSPDPYVQASDFSQSFNRYPYVRNSPLIFTDPTGEKLKWWQWAAIGLGLDALTVGVISMSVAGTEVRIWKCIARPSFCVLPACLKPHGRWLQRECGRESRKKIIKLCVSRQNYSS